MKNELLSTRKRSVATIGYRGHAKRIIDLIDASDNAELDCIFHPIAEIEDPRGENNIYELLKRDAVFILSPNDTHFKYMKFLDERGYRGKIFCEKPPFSSWEELKRFENQNENVYFNFNFRMSKLTDIVKECQVFLGELINARVAMTHGLSFKESYARSWRADKKRHTLGVIETVGVHWIDLLRSLMGDVCSFDIQTGILSGAGTACDTANITLRHGKTQQASISNIFVSYATAKSFEFTLYGTQGFLRYSDGTIKLHWPRDKFDENGFFIEPPIARQWSFNVDEDYARSLEKSVNYFLGDFCDESNLYWNVGEYIQSIESNKLILNISDSL